MDFFSMMFTADAAAKHGHEFSPQTMPVEGGNRDGSAVNGNGALPNHHHMRLPRPLSVLPRARPQHTLSRSRQRPHSMKITMAELKEDPEGEQADEEEELRKIDAKIRSFTIPGAFEDTPPSSRTSVEGPDATAAAVRLEPEKDVLESEDLSIPVARETSDETHTSTSTGEGTESTQSRRGPNRSKVFYRLGRPHGEKKHILRPKCLLQVQETSGRFHRPIYDVVPGSRFNPRTKIGQKLRRLKKNKDGTGADDLVVVRSEHQQESKEDGSEEEHEKEVDHEHETLNGQEVLGTIQPAEDGPSAYITLGETVWKGTLDGTGSIYTLENAADASTERARWYIPKAKRAASVIGTPREFNFTILQPGIKRHPVVAKMSEGHLEFYEESVSTVDPETIIPTDEAMRRLIVASGLWVYFCEGWSKHYDFHSAVATSTRPVPGRSQSTRSTNRGLRDILRSPSRSPAPSLCRAATSASSDTRSREGSHDSTATTTSPAATMLRYPKQRHASDSQTNTPVDSRAPSPEVQMRGRRRWSASFTQHFRRFSHSVKHPASTTNETAHHQVPSVPPIPPLGETIITADLVHVEHLPENVAIDQHPLQKAFIKPMKAPTTILVSSSETVVDDVEEVFVPAMESVEHSKQGFAVYPTSSTSDTTPSPQPEDVSLHHIPTSQPTPKRPPHLITTAPTPPQLDGPSEHPPTTPSPLRPHRFGLGDLARPRTVFTSQHRRTESSSSSDFEGEDGHGIGRGWWHQYDRMVLKREGSGVVPTS